MYSKQYSISLLDIIQLDIIHFFYILRFLCFFSQPMGFVSWSHDALKNISLAKIRKFPNNRTRPTLGSWQKKVAIVKMLAAKLDQLEGLFQIRLV